MRYIGPPRITLDEDTLASDSDLALATQQSIKAYVDTNAGGGLVFLSAQSASASATVDFDNVFDSTYEVYMLTYSNVQVATDGADMYCRFGTGATPTYQTTNYRYAVLGSRAGAAVARDSSNSTASAIIMNEASPNGPGNVTGEEIHGVMHIYSPSEAVETHCTFSQSREDQAAYMHQEHGSGKYDSTTAVTSIRFLASTGNIAHGEFRLYGIKKS